MIDPRLADPSGLDPDILNQSLPPPSASPSGQTLGKDDDAAMHARRGAMSPPPRTVKYHTKFHGGKRRHG